LGVGEVKFFASLIKVPPMISYKDLSPTQLRIFAVGGVVLGVALIVLLAASDLDLTPLRTLRTVPAGGGAVLETQFNPLGILGISAVGLAVVAAFGALIMWFAPRLSGLSLGGASGSAIASKASKSLEQELGKVLGLIRSHISTNESYAKSLASAQARLSALPEAAQVRVIVALLVSENERMRQDSLQLTSKLEDSKKQIEVLRTNLSAVEEVVLKDPLTGIGNRRCFDVTMEKTILESRQKNSVFSLIMCDIDHFKRVNDAFGHQVGDEIIKMFSRVIESSVREGDSIVRYGGEEFAIILPMTDQDSAKSIAERIRRQFESKKLTIRETSQKVGQLTASFGVAQYRPGDDADMIVQRADAKLYDAKSGGRNRVAAFGSGD
jgi:diguanylate cyclase